MHDLLHLLCSTNHLPFLTTPFLSGISIPSIFSITQVWKLSVSFTISSLEFSLIMSQCPPKCPLKSPFPPPFPHFTPVIALSLHLLSPPSDSFWLTVRPIFSLNQCLHGSRSLNRISTDYGLKAKLLWQTFKATHNLAPLISAIYIYTPFSPNQWF